MNPTERAPYSPRRSKKLLSLLNPPETTSGKSWHAEYEIVMLWPNFARFDEKINSRAGGRLVLDGSPGKLKVDHLNLAHSRDAEHLTAEVCCRNDQLATLTEWRYTSRFDKKPDPERMTGLHENCAIKNNVFYRDGKPSVTLSSGAACTSDYSLFCAMPGISKDWKLPQNFDMLEALTTIRRDQKFHKTGTGTLADGRTFTELVQWGTGILPWFWWLDSNGFPVACIREHQAFLLQKFGGLS